jgi:hypothetical protein
MERFNVGHCRNGKIVTSHADLDGLASKEEIFDALVMLSLLAVQARRQDKNSDETIHLEQEVGKLQMTFGSSKAWEKQMMLIGAKTALDLRRYAYCLLLPELRR